MYKQGLSGDCFETNFDSIVAAMYSKACLPGGYISYEQQNPTSAMFVKAFK
jgi:hypothetical protein